MGEGVIGWVGGLGGAGLGWVGGLVEEGGWVGR